MCELHVIPFPMTKWIFNYYIATPSATQTLHFFLIKRYIVRASYAVWDMSKPDEKGEEIESFASISVLFAEYLK